jgi:hypothetical protein
LAGVALDGVAGYGAAKLTVEIQNKLAATAIAEDGATRIPNRNAGVASVVADESPLLPQEIPAIEVPTKASKSNLTSSKSNISSHSNKSSKGSNISVHRNNSSSISKSNPSNLSSHSNKSSKSSNISSHRSNISSKSQNNIASKSSQNTSFVPGPLGECPSEKILNVMKHPIAKIVLTAAVEEVFKVHDVGHVYPLEFGIIVS